MRLFGLFKQKDQGTGLSEIKHMHDLLDLPGLLSSLSTVDRKYLAQDLDFILDILTNQPHMVRLHGNSLPAPILKAPIGDDPTAQDRWLDLTLKLVELGYLDTIMEQGLPEIISALLLKKSDIDWRISYLAMEVCRRKHVTLMTSDEHISSLIRALESGDPRGKQYVAASLDRIMVQTGADPFLRLGGIERMRPMLLETDQYVADTVRSIIARCETKATVHDRMGSMVVEETKVITPQEEAQATAGKKAEEAKESTGGYYRPGSRQAASRSRGPARRVEQEAVVEDMNLRKRKVDDRFEVEKKAVLAKEAETVFTGHQDPKPKKKEEEEEFELEG